MLEMAPSQELESNGKGNNIKGRINHRGNHLCQVNPISTLEGQAFWRQKEPRKWGPSLSMNLVATTYSGGLWDDSKRRRQELLKPPRQITSVRSSRKFRKRFKTKGTSHLMILLPTCQQLRTRMLRRRSDQRKSSKVIGIIQETKMKSSMCNKIRTLQNSGIISKAISASNQLHQEIKADHNHAHYPQASSVNSILETKHILERQVEVSRVALATIVLDITATVSWSFETKWRSWATLWQISTPPLTIKMTIKIYLLPHIWSRLMKYTTILSKIIKLMKQWKALRKRSHLKSSISRICREKWVRFPW